MTAEACKMNASGLEILQSQQLPSSTFHILDVQLERKVSSVGWKICRVVVTKKRIILAKEDQIIDFIPLLEVSEIVTSNFGTGNHADGDHKHAAQREDKENAENGFRTFAVHTIAEGLNAGKAFHFRAKQTVSPSTTHLEDKIQDLIRAEKALDARNAQFQNAQEWAKLFYDSLQFQFVTGVCIFVNFFLGIMQTQFVPISKGEFDEEKAAFALCEIVFVVFFTLELFINLVAHWCTNFFANAWSVYDLIIVVCSWIAISGSGDIPAFSVLRTLQLFRLVRVFFNQKPLIKILNALTTSLWPILHALLILLVMLAIYAVLGVRMFAERAPDDFGSFLQACFTMMRVGAGMVWLPDILAAFREDGTIVAEVWIYGVTFILVMNFVFLHLFVAIMVDGFVEARAMEGQNPALHGPLAQKQFGCHSRLDPLLALLMENYISANDFLHQVSSIYQKLDVDERGQLSLEELSSGLSRMPFHPKILICESDLVLYCEDAGVRLKQTCEVSLPDFVAILQHQIPGYVRWRMNQVMHFKAESEECSAQMQYNKLMLWLQEANMRKMTGETKQLSDKLDLLLLSTKSCPIEQAVHQKPAEAVTYTIYKEEGSLPSHSNVNTRSPGHIGHMGRDAPAHFRHGEEQLTVEDRRAQEHDKARMVRDLHEAVLSTLERASGSHLASVDMVNLSSSLRQSLTAVVNQSGAASSVQHDLPLGSSLFNPLEDHKTLPPQVLLPPAVDVPSTAVDVPSTAIKHSGSTKANRPHLDPPSPENKTKSQNPTQSTPTKETRFGHWLMKELGGASKSTSEDTSPMSPIKARNLSIHREQMPEVAPHANVNHQPDVQLDVVALAKMEKDEMHGRRRTSATWFSVRDPLRSSNNQSESQKALPIPNLLGGICSGEHQDLSENTFTQSNITSNEREYILSFRHKAAKLHEAEEVSRQGESEVTNESAAAAQKSGTQPQVTQMAAQPLFSEPPTAQSPTTQSQDLGNPGWRWGWT